MAYGANMEKLSPCSDQRVLGTLIEACPCPETLLDAGCGRGERLAAAAAALPQTKRFGIDLDAENAAAARSACPGAEIVTGDVCALPWGDGSFDAALCECTLSLLSEPERCLSELYRVLRPAGVLLLSDLIGGDAEPVRTLISPTGAVRYLASPAWIEAATADAGFRTLRRIGCREEYLEMIGQMIFDGVCGCVDPETFAALRKKRTGYGMWILERGGRI